MNIFNLPIEEAEKEIDKLLNSYSSVDELVKDLEQCGLKIERKKEDI